MPSPEIQSIRWSDGRVLLLDQTRLPNEQVVLEIATHEAMIEAIKALRIRGAPALGVAAAYGIVLGAQQLAGIDDRAAFLTALAHVRDQIVSARPTAVNKAWAAERIWRSVPAHVGAEEIRSALLAEADRIMAEDIQANRAMGAFGAALIPAGGTVLTHCNTGSLATAGYGTALGVLRAAKEMGKAFRVIATETRPLLQGARLTAWELVQDGFDATLITDSMAGHFMKAGRIQCVIVGADRIAMNGDVANKIGSYSLAVLAGHHGLPFYVAAPTSTIDPALHSGDGIPIEERDPREVAGFREVRTAPEGIAIANPAFDVTPNAFVTAIVTERGVAKPPYPQTLKELLSKHG